MQLRKPDGYKELLVYKRAEELRRLVLALTEKLPYSEQRRKVHLNDSARSVKQNIVEGWKRSTTKEYYEFLSFSLGSLAEIKEDIKDLFEDGKISEKTLVFFDDKCRELDYLLNRLRQSLYAKMEKEGGLPTREIKRKIINNRAEEDDIVKKIMTDAGLISLENGKVVGKDSPEGKKYLEQKGEKG